MTYHHDELDVDSHLELTRAEAATRGRRASAAPMPLSIALPYGQRDVTGQRQIAWTNVGAAYVFTDQTCGMGVRLSCVPSARMLEHLVITQPKSLPGEADLPAFVDFASQLIAYDVIGEAKVRIGHATRSENSRGYTVHISHVPTSLQFVLFPAEGEEVQADMQA